MMQINKLKLLKRIILLGLIISSILFFGINKIVKGYGYSGVFEVITTYSSNSTLAKEVTPIHLKLNISDSDYEFIKDRRQVALDRGLQINDVESYVPCGVVSGVDSVQGEMRLKGHMTDHLEGDKWSFRVKTDQEILGMYRFSLQHPGTRNYVYEWIYHELLKNEDVIYLKYDFLNLQLNDKDLGIYAVEEHFGQHVLDRNNRPKGAILRWNPSLFWEWRIDEYQGIYLDEDFSSYSSSFAEPYDKSVVLKDEELIENYQIAAYNLEQFRRGELITSDVFDVEKMARFHAVIDLVGGHHSLDWSDVKFYYNSKTKKIEPVGYESFSVQKSEHISGQQIPNSYERIQEDYHIQLFSDPVFFEAYIRNLERIASEDYLKDFQEKIKIELDQKIGVLAKEWPYRKFTFDAYYENIRLIRNNLDLPKALHAFVQTNNSDSVTLSLAPVSDFPIEIIALQKKNKTFSLDEKFVLPPKARNTMIKYFDITFQGNFKKIKDLVLLAKIPGSSNVFEIEVAPYPSYKKEFEQKKINDKESNFDTTLLNVQGHNVSFKSKESNVNEKIIIPDGYSLVLYPGQKIVLNAELVIFGSINSHGYTEDNVEINVNKNGNLKVLGVLKATNTQFSGEHLISSYGASLDFYHCQIYDVQDCFIEDFQSNITMNECCSGNVNVLCQLNETSANLSECTFNNSEMLIDANASLINIKNSNIKNCTNVSKLNYSTQFNLARSTLSNSTILFQLSNSSSFKSYSGHFYDFDTGIVVAENEAKLEGHSDYLLYRTKTTGFNTLERKQ